MVKDVHINKVHKEKVLYIIPEGHSLTLKDEDLFRKVTQVSFWGDSLIGRRFDRAHVIWPKGFKDLPLRAKQDLDNYFNRVIKCRLLPRGQLRQWYL